MMSASDAHDKVRSVPVSGNAQTGGDSRSFNVRGRQTTLALARQRKRWLRCGHDPLRMTCRSAMRLDGVNAVHKQCVGGRAVPTNGGSTNIAVAVA
jgi:hypothetical protein